MQAAPATDHKHFMKIRQKKAGRTFTPAVCTYSCLAGRRLEVGEEATNEIIHGSTVRLECVGMHALTEVWGPG